MKRYIVTCLAAVLLFPAIAAASNLIVKVKNVETALPICRATVTLITYDEKNESWVQGSDNWWGVVTTESGIALRLNLELWQKCVIKAEAKGYFPTFYGMPFYFYGVPKVITIDAPNTILEIFLQPIKESPEPPVGAGTTKK